MLNAPAEWPVEARRLSREGATEAPHRAVPLRPAAPSSAEADGGGAGGEAGNAFEAERLARIARNKRELAALLMDAPGGGSPGAALDRRKRAARRPQDVVAERPLGRDQEMEDPQSGVLVPVVPLLADVPAGPPSCGRTRGVRELHMRDAAAGKTLVVKHMLEEDPPGGVLVVVRPQLAPAPETLSNQARPSTAVSCVHCLALSAGCLCAEAHATCR